MLITKEIIQKNSEQFNLNVNKFLFIEKKSYFKKKYYLIYKPYEFFFQIDKDKNDLNNYFPYFSERENYSNIQNWCCSIKDTLVKSNKVVKDLNDSKDLRDKFKKRYKV